MAVAIMSACCRVSLLSLCVLGGFLQVLSQEQVFQVPPNHNVFLRSKRANQFLVEEILQGNLERECYEEHCNYEEAREYFEDDDRTIAFWTVYYDGDQCQPNPCLHGGNCTDKIGGFLCTCPDPHYGQVCDLGPLEDGGASPTAPQVNAAEVSECPTGGPTACHQLCTASYYSFRCSCLPGFKLQEDKRTCSPEAEFPCGQLPPDFSTAASVCDHGKCPWQVSLLTRRGAVPCSGAVLGRRSILTAASCLQQESERTPHLQPSDFFIVTGLTKNIYPVRAVYLHNRYRKNYHDYNLAMLELSHPLPFSPRLIHLCLPTKDFCENVLMHSGRTGISTRPGLSGTEELVYMTLDECRSQLNISHPISNKMFCMKTLNEHSGGLNHAQRSLDGAPEGPLRIQNGTQEQQCGALLQGTPVVTIDRGTVFVTGLLLSSSEGCDESGLVFTKLSRYLNWIRPRVEAADDRMTQQVIQYPDL